MNDNNSNQFSKCWICGNIADSEEHKIKASDLRRYLGKNFDAFYKSDESIFEGKTSYKNRLFKFPKIICQNCNNNVTKDADVSYDEFAKYIDRNFNSLINDRHIDFCKIYGEGWISQKQDLYRYFAKHAGCKIYSGDGGKTINLSELSAFILGNDTMVNFHITFQINEIINLFSNMLRIANIDGLTSLGNGATIYFKDDNNTIFCGSIINSFLRVEWIFTDENHNIKKVDFDNQYETFELLSFDNYYPYSFSEHRTNEEAIEYLIFGGYGNDNIENLIEHFKKQYNQLKL